MFQAIFLYSLIPLIKEFMLLSYELKIIFYVFRKPTLFKRCIATPDIHFCIVTGYTADSSSDCILS